MAGQKVHTAAGSHIYVEYTCSDKSVRRISDGNDLSSALASMPKGTISFRFIEEAQEAEGRTGAVGERIVRYFVGGRVMTLAEIQYEMPDMKHLVEEMERRGSARAVVTENGAFPLTKDDVVIRNTFLGSAKRD